MKPSLQYVLVRAIRNMRRNLFPNITTVGVITISVLIFSAFSLIAYNLASFLRIWEDKIEVIAYLKKKTPAGEIETLLDKIRQMEGVESVNYVSPSDAIAFMEAKLGDQKNLLEGIHSAVLPPSLEVQLKKEYRDSTKIGGVVSQLKQFPQMEEIQYGQEWVDLFSSLVHILRLTQWVLGGLLLLAMVFIISNTLQLAISSRREEIEIMQLVGASPSFIQVPFYLEGMIQGLVGAGLALSFLFLLQKIVLFYLPSSMKDWLVKIPILFLPINTLVGILLGGMILGFLGSYMASVRFLKSSQ
ncbi:MAG: ABC transporter permease [Deltaproteobacteria bacterium]|nr:MAG: ABC transporter permease [Deltaproteobacteria bacterium]